MDIFRIILDILGKLLQGGNVPSQDPIQSPVPIPTKMNPFDYAVLLKKEVSAPKYIMTPDNPNTPQNESATYCNFFVTAVSHWFGYHGFDEKMANAIVTIVETSPYNWKMVTYAEAPKLAAKGYLLVAGWKNPTGEHGHVCIIPPIDRVETSASWGCEVPMAANVGKSNFYEERLSKAFTIKPTIYQYIGMPNV